MYQEQISALNNPQRPLSRGEAVSLENPLTGKNVAFDDCRESDGTMIEAKARLCATDEISLFRREHRPGLGRTSQNARRRRRRREVAWYFAEPEAAEKARKLFENDQKLRKIKVIYEPAEAP